MRCACGAVTSIQKHTKANRRHFLRDFSLNMQTFVDPNSKRIKCMIDTAMKSATIQNKHAVSKTAELEFQWNLEFMEDLVYSVQSKCTLPNNCCFVLSAKRF